MREEGEGGVVYSDSRLCRLMYWAVLATATREKAWGDKHLHTVSLDALDRSGHTMRD